MGSVKPFAGSPTIWAALRWECLPLAGYWPQLTKVWPAYQDFYSKEGQRSVFVPEPDSQP
jgi:hypothetical protein